MPNFNVKSLKNNRKHYKKKKNSFFFGFLFLIVFMLLIINFSDIFSSIITNKNSLFIVDKIEIPSYSVYAVSIKDFSNLTEANECAEQVKAQGGAGLIYENGEKFVLLMGYSNLIEAKEIQNNFIELGYNSRIVNLKVNAVSHKYNGNNVNVLTKALSIFREIFLELNQAILKLDKNEISRNQFNSVITKFIVNITKIQKELNLKKDNFDIEYIKIINDKLSVVKDYINEILYLDCSDKIFSSYSKEISLKLIFENIEMNNKINRI